MRENTKGTVYTAIKIFSRVLFTFPWSINHKSFFSLSRNYYTFQKVWYASKMNHAITGPFVRISGSLFPQWDILLCRCGKNGRLKETTKHLLPVNFFPTLRWHLENSRSSFKQTDCFNFHQKFRHPKPRTYE